jgi:hypothetical protein
LTVGKIRQSIDITLGTCEICQRKKQTD